MILWWYFENLPLHDVLAIQDLRNLLPTPRLVLWVGGQIIQDEGDAAGSGVMALKHERVHFCSYIFIREALLILILETKTFVYIIDQTNASEYHH